MKGTIRVFAGLLMIMGGVGGIESNTTSAIPLGSLVIAVAGALILAWGSTSANKQETENA